MNNIKYMLESKLAVDVYGSLIEFLNRQVNDLDGWAINMARAYVMVICDIEDIEVDTMMWDRLINDSYNEGLRENWGDEFSVEDYDLAMSE